MARVALKQRIQEIWRKLAQLDARPDQIAAGFSIGIAASFLPLNPSPILVAAAVAWVLRRNMIAAAAGAASAIPFTLLLPLVWLAEYRLGTLVFPAQHSLTLNATSLREILHEGWDVYAAMLIGAIAIATPVTVLTYWIVKRLAERVARRRETAGRSDL